MKLKLFVFSTHSLTEAMVEKEVNNWAELYNYEITNASIAFDPNGMMFVTVLYKKA